MINPKPNKNFLLYCILLATITIFVMQGAFYINFFRPEENHYLWVAYYIFQHHSWFILHDSNGIYFNKPPLLFWLINSLWLLFGLSTWTIHLLLAGILLLTLYFAEQLCRMLFDNDDDRLRWSCPIIMFGSILFLQRSINLSFDILVVFFNLIAFIGIVYSLTGKWRGYWLLGAAIGCNLLTKGPICLGFIIPFIIVASFFRKKHQISFKQWLGGLAISIILAIIILSVWFIPLFDALNYHQLHTLIIDRAFKTSSYGHNSIGTYFKSVIVFMLPWIFWPFAMQALVKEIYLSFIDKSRWSQRLLLFSFILSFILLNTITAKHNRYVFTWVFIISVFYFAAILKHQSFFKASFWQGRYLNVIFIVIAILGLIIAIFTPTQIINHISYWAMTINDIQGLLILLLLGNITLLCLRSSPRLELVRYAGISFITLLVFYVIPGNIVSSAFQTKDFAILLHQLQKKPACIIYQANTTGYLYHVGKNTIVNGGANDNSCLYSQHYFVSFVANPVPQSSNIIASYRYTDGRSSIVVSSKRINKGRAE